MKGFEYRSGGRRVSEAELWEHAKQTGLDMAFEHLKSLAHGAAASIVDPATGKHAAVFVRRVGNHNHVIRTEGSPGFARELERRLGVDRGTIETVTPLRAGAVPHVYLAHASEDHSALARPLANRLMENGVEVWLDAWEIRTGDSLKRKMEEGLGGCTHFVVLLTPNSLGKPWVETEIDVGFVRAVNGESRFLGLRVGVPVSALSPFLQTLRCPELDPNSDAAVRALTADLHGVSSKPSRGPAPRFVQSVPAGIQGWSPGAAAVAEYLVERSHDGVAMDPQARMSEVAAETGLSEEDVRLGVLDLEDAGLVQRSGEQGSDRFWPRTGLFVEFDRHFMGFDTEADAIAIANRLVSEGLPGIDLNHEFADRFPDRTVRQLNSALGYLEEGRFIEVLRTSGQAPWLASEITITDRTRRLVRDHG